MEKTISSPKARPGAIGRIAVVLAIGVVGLVFAHHPILFSGFRRIQTDLADGRLIHYLLEHGYLWFKGIAGHRRFWDPPFFYPVLNATAYSDPLLSFGPVYWLCRALGASPDVSLLLWMLTMSALNYAAGVLLFRKALGLALVPSAVGSFLVAFGAPRVNQLVHLQMLPCFYVILSVCALAWLFGGRAATLLQRWACWLLASLGVVLQFYGGVYLAWFLVVAAAISLVAALLLKSCRYSLLQILKRDHWPMLVSGVLAMLLLFPFIEHVRPVARQVAQSQYIPTYRMLHPRQTSWLSMGDGSWLWGWMAARAPFRAVVPGGELFLGIGLVTPFACVAGLYLNCERPACRLAAVVACAIWFGTTYLPGDFFATAALLVCCYCLAGLFRATKDPASRGLGLVVMLGLLLAVPFPSPLLTVLALSVMTYCLMEIFRSLECVELQVIPAMALGCLCVRFFDLRVLLTALGLLAPLSGLAAYRRILQPGTLWFLSLCLFILFCCLVTYPAQPDLLLATAVLTALAMAATGSPQVRAPAWLLVRALMVSLYFVVVFYHHDSLWLRVREWIPGGVGIRAIGRVVLILLIPAGLGLAALIQYLMQNKHAALAWTLALLCIIEQGVTTETFDAAANQERIARVARQVIPGHEAFFYHPLNDESFFHDQVDAMWASMQVGVPTINGYSGYYPPGWDGFFLAGFQPWVDLREVLVSWEQRHQLSPSRIQWIGVER
jgi:hypothetical protein